MHQGSQSLQPSTATKQEQKNPTHKLIKQDIIQNNKPAEKYKIGKYQYTTSDFLGQGFSSSVYKCTLIDNKKQKFAIKVIHLQKFQPEQRQLLETEIEIITSLSHPNIIRFVDSYKTNENYFLITEYCPHGDLNQLIRLQNYITEDKVIPIIRQVIDGYKYLMNRNIIHRDLKPANIMRFGNQWKIGDFGFAKYSKQQYLIQKLYVGTPFYMPPQSLELNKYSFRSDIFAIGIILYEMLTGETPWPSKDQKQLIDSMRQNPLNIPRFIMSKQIRQFLQRSIVLDYYQRMSKEQFKKFSLQNVDVQKIAKTRPGRGLSPVIKRELSKSGKKSFLFGTPAKNRKNDFLVLTTNKNTFINVKSSQNMPKKNFDYLKPYIQKHLQFDGSPVSIKMFRENSEIMNNQVEMVKVINHFAINCGILGLSSEQQAFICLIMHLLGLKMLKMIGNKRQNYYKLGKWDVYRQSEKYRSYVTQILAFITKFQTQYKQYKSSINSKEFQKFQEQFPELIQNTSISYKIYSKIFDRLRHFIRYNIIESKNKIQQTNVSSKCHLIKQLIEIMNAIKNRTRREQQIMGFGLKTKPECLTFKGINWSADTLSISLKQLEMVCKHKVQLQ